MASSHALLKRTEFSVNNYIAIRNKIEENKLREAKILLEIEIRDLKNASNEKKSINEDTANQLIGLITWAQSKCTQTIQPRDEIRLHVQQAMVYELQGKYDCALSKYAEIRKNYTGQNHHAYLYAVDILVKQKKYQEAETLLKRFFRQDLIQSTPMPKAQLKKAKDMLTKIKEKKLNSGFIPKEKVPSKEKIFSREKPMHLFFAELAKSLLAERKNEDQQNQVQREFKRKHGW